MNDLDRLSWPAERVSETIEALARKSNLSLQPAEIPLPSRKVKEGDDETLGRRVEAIASKMGLEAKPVWTPYAEVEELLRSAGPALIRLPGQGQVHFLALLGGGRRAMTILGPDVTVHRLRLEVIRSALCQEVEAPVVAETERLI
ncbi:MAG: hypothetical protein GTN93_35300, partial [Anaerolineae bacterium]|nr:hypothetical protein [Anaerolineae bacterium]